MFFFSDNFWLCLTSKNKNLFAIAIDVKLKKKKSTAIKQWILTICVLTKR